LQIVTAVDRAIPPTTELSVLGKYYPEQLHEDDCGKKGRAGHHQQQTSPNATGQDSEDRGPIKRNPKPHSLGCEQECEKQGVPARQFNRHESNCSACVIWAAGGFYRLLKSGVAFEKSMFSFKNKLKLGIENV
jgi:hypothetical protein